MKTVEILQNKQQWAVKRLRKISQRDILLIAVTVSPKRKSFKISGLIVPDTWKFTPPSDHFKYFKQLLARYPCHQLMAKWQQDEVDICLNIFPWRTRCVCIHNYSKGYTCRQRDETQLEYFDNTKVSLHITILNRQAVDACDGKSKHKNELWLIKEHMLYTCVRRMSHNCAYSQATTNYTTNTQKPWN